jgi:hypothetical protein
MKHILLTAAMLLISTSLAIAAPVYSPVTGHYYERIDKDITWVAAKQEAESLSFNGAQGYLATITSEQENWWIVNNLGSAATLDHWLGGYLENDNWKWITGETWSYTNWWNGGGWIEPSGDGNALQFDDDERIPPLPGYWNDLDKNNPESGYIVEYGTTPVLLPGSFWLFGSGLAGLIGYIKLKRNRGA